MRNYNLFIFILLGVLGTSCGDKENSLKLDASKIKPTYTLKDKLNLSVLNPDSAKIDSVSFAINNKRIGGVKSATDFSFSLENQRFGSQTVLATIYTDGKTVKDSVSIEVISDIEPVAMSYEIVNTYPHDITAYTEGLEFYNGFLYEGTGNGAGQSGKRGTSSLRKVDYKTGKVLQKVEYPDSVFGEGISFLNGKVYQLTYKNNEVYVYDAATLTKEKTMPYYRKMEGWGMTNDGTYLYYNDSSETIHKINPVDFKQLDSINVYSGGTRIPEVNELEWVDGYMYMNIFMKDAVAKVNPKTGAVEGVLNLADLKNKITMLEDTDVLNGIAYNPKTKTFFVTGKNWDKLFEIRIK